MIKHGISLIIAGVLFMSTPAISKSLNTNTNVGSASWYNVKGKRTASGKHYSGYTVAHRSLPFGTRLLVTNILNGRQITAVVNDRGPFIRGRIIDLSANAADALSFRGRGHTKVHIQIVH